jgi:peptidoglycan hydrolase CwlO-like protein
MKKFFLSSICLLMAFAPIPGILNAALVRADSQSQQIAALNQQIALYEQEIKQAGADKKTLQTALNTLDLQRAQVEAEAALTQTQIQTTQTQIQQLDGQISDAKETIDGYQATLAQDLRNLEQQDDQPQVVDMLLSGSLTGAWQDYDQNLQIQDAVQVQEQKLQAQEAVLALSETNYQQQQSQLSAENISLASQQQSLNTTVASKNRLLAETSNKEATYQKLLAQAQAQLQSFSKFTQGAGGDGLLSGQTACDAWGCYYNQRDSAWGSQSLDGTAYTMASDGCLVTAMAMVYTHYGYKSVTPATINSDPNNFAAYYPAYLLNTITVDGATASRVSSEIDATLSSGDPVIVGLTAYGGGHYVVLTNGSNGNYIMRDPYVSGGDNVSFTSHYSLREITSITKVEIGS